MKSPLAPLFQRGDLLRDGAIIEANLRLTTTLAPTCWGLVLLVLLIPLPVLACPVCFSAANGQVLETYYLTTVLMTLLPLLIVGSIAGWLYLRFREPRAGIPD